VQFVLRDEIPFELIAGFQRQFSNEFTSCPTVAFAKRMQRIDFRKVVSGALAECLWVRFAQKLLACEPLDRFWTSGMMYSGRAKNELPLARLTVRNSPAHA